MFGLCKRNKTKLPSSLINFLNEADTEYMKAFAIKNTKVLKDHLSRDCIIKIGQEVFSIGTRYFGAEKFRKTSWTILSDMDGVVEVLKTVTFDKIKVGGSLSISVQTNYKELWVVGANNGYRVTDIKKM